MIFNNIDNFNIITMLNTIEELKTNNNNNKEALQLISEDETHSLSSEDIE